jgi:hypothetical protein
MVKRIISMGVITLIIISSFSLVMAKESDGNPSKDLLLIMENQTEYDPYFIKQSPDLEIDIVEFDSIKEFNTNDFYEIAAPISKIDKLKSILRNAYADGQKVYLYGELTIDQYNKILKLDKYGVDVSIEVYDAETGFKEKKEAFMTFSNEYINNEIHNVIALCKNNSNGMIASIPKNDKGLYDESLLLKAVIDEVEHHNAIGLLSTPTPIDQDFSIKTYTIAGDFAIMDWFLYQQSDTNPEYDYFAIKTNLGLEGSYYLGTKMWVYDDLVYSEDEYLDSGPGDSSESTSFEISLGFGEDGPYGSIGWTFELDNAPEIDRSVSLYNDYAHWTCEEDFYTLDGEIFSPGMSWASVGTLAAIDIEFKGRFVNFQINDSMDTNWKTVEVRYDY